MDISDYQWAQKRILALMGIGDNNLEIFTTHYATNINQIPTRWRCHLRASAGGEHTRGLRADGHPREPAICHPHRLLPPAADTLAALSRTAADPGWRVWLRSRPTQWCAAHWHTYPCGQHHQGYDGMYPSRREKSPPTPPTRGERTTSAILA